MIGQILLFLLVAGCATLIFHVWGELTATRARLFVQQEQVARWREVAEHDTQQHREFVRDLRAEHLREIERIVAFHRDEIERLTNAMQFGRASLPDAERISAPADAETRVLKAIGEDTRADAITRGAENLKQMYQEAGLILSDEEARLQASAMVHGEPLDRITV